MTPGEQSTRIEQLLADRAVFGLSAEEEAELASLREQAVDDVSDYDLVGSLLMASEVASAGKLPQTLASEIRSAAILDQSSVPATANESAARPNIQPPPARLSAGWLAAACLLVVALFGWLRDTSAPTPAAPTLAELRDQLLKNAEDTVTIRWLPSEDPAAVSATGDVVWSRDRQTGFMRITGLDANDPAVQQYQLWIIDGQRDPAQPVDGGVFDIPTGVTEVIIPIDAKLMVYDARAFAVTIEKPGGVVVSERKRLPLLASVDA